MNGQDADDPREGFRVITPLRVRYNEGDIQGIVFNANYLLYADVGISEYFRVIMANGAGGVGILGGFLERYGGDIWVRHADIDFKAPAKIDDNLDIAVRINRFGRTSLSTLIHIIHEGVLINRISLTQVWFDPATQKIAPVSQKFIDDVTEFERVKPQLQLEGAGKKGKP